jgi:polysaccharide chain length determinant protein (PEP-CTERM system associated)
MSAEYELTLHDYLSIARRWVFALIGVFVAVLLGAIIVAFSIPPTYLATGTIAVEFQQVPDTVAVTAARKPLEERINIIRQRVMTRDSMLGIADRYGLFKTSPRSEVVEKMRARIGVETANADSMQSNPQSRPIAFSLSFQDKSPQVAYSVTVDLVTLFLDWNRKLRTEGASETTAFLTQESEKLKSEVDRIEGLIAAYKRQNAYTLPEQLNVRAGMLARAEDDLREVERDARSTREELRALHVELAAARGAAGGGSAQSLPELREELARLLATYKESHPDVRELRRKIAAMEQEAGNSGGVEHPTSAAGIMIQSKINAANARLDALERQRRALQDKISQNEQSMIITPRVGQELETLIRDRDSAQKKYEEILSKKMNAQIAENMETENKSDRFYLLEPPVLPELPFKPNRLKIAVLGFFLAVAAAAAALMAVASFDRQVRNPEVLARIMGHPPLVVIPYLVIHEEEVQQRHFIKLMVAWSVLGVATILGLLHFLYMPLNELVAKLISRLM